MFEHSFRLFPEIAAVQRETHFRAQYFDARSELSRMADHISALQCQLEESRARNQELHTQLLNAGREAVPCDRCSQSSDESGAADCYLAGLTPARRYTPSASSSGDSGERAAWGAPRPADALVTGVQRMLSDNEELRANLALAQGRIRETRRFEELLAFQQAVLYEAQRDADFGRRVSGLLGKSALFNSAIY